MKRSFVVLALPLMAALQSPVAAQDSLEFTLDEVDSAEETAKTKGKSKAPSVDTKQAIQEALGELRWGMSKADLLKILKAQIRAEFEQRIKVERDIMRQDALYQQAQDQARRLSENYVTFEGPKTGWDVSPIGREFTHGNRETMLVVTGKSSRDFYFFIQGKLWKWYRELSNETPADETVAELEERFGRGKPQKERHNDSEIVYPGATWSDGATRVTALQRGSDACLILEDQATIDQLAVLRHNTQPNAKKAQTSAVIDSILLSGAETGARQ
jgi:hypothetical protein